MKKGLPAGRQGFTLIEILIVLILFGVLMIVGTNMFLSVVQNSNRATIQNDVRQNAENILGDISANIRASSNITINGTTLLISSPSGTVTYSQDGSGNLIRNGSRMNSNSVVVCANTTPCGALTCDSPGLTVSCPPGSPQICFVSVTVQQKLTTVRWDQCAMIKLQDSITARSY